MNFLKNLFKSTKIADYLKTEFLELSTSDGKPGLSTGDLIAVAQRIAQANIPGATSKDKADNVALWVAAKFPNKIAGWTTAKLIQLAYLYAKEKGMVK